MEFAKQVPEDDASEGIATSLAQTKGCPTEDKGLAIQEPAWEKRNTRHTTLLALQNITNSEKFVPKSV